jgi:hypothetical protein
MGFLREILKQLLSDKIKTKADIQNFKKSFLSNYLLIFLDLLNTKPLHKII